MSEIGVPELIKRLDAVIGLLVVTLPQEGRKLFYGYIDMHDSTRLRKAYPNTFKV